MTEPTPEFNRIADCRHGRMIYNVNDVFIGRSLVAYGEYSEGEVEVFRHFLREGDTAVEVGSNIGAHTVPLAKLVGEKGIVFAFEAQRLVYQTLCGNVALNSLRNVWTMQGAIGTGEGTIRIPDVNPHALVNFGGLELGVDVPGSLAPVIALDEMAIDRCRLLKIDVEGMELEVLRGAAELIKKSRPILCVENDRAAKSEALIAHLRSLDYRMFWHNPPLFSPRNFNGNPQNIFGRVASMNMICVPNETSDSLEAADLTTPVYPWTPSGAK